MPYFKECLESILKQTYSNWELILVDDNSSDESTNIALNYSVLDTRIKQVKSEGNGIIDALITGSKLIKGSFITRMDADDLMRVDKIELMRNRLIDKGNNHVCVGGVKYFSSGKTLGDGYINYAKWLNKLTYNESNFNDIFKECTIPSPCWMLHKKDFTKLNKFNDLTYPEDYDLAFKMNYYNLKVTGVKEEIHFWRDHGKRISRNSTVYQFENFIKLKLKYFISNELQEDQKLILWGAGKKGKKIAKELKEKKQSFVWATGNENKKNKIIYDQKVLDEKIFKEDYKKLILVAISELNFKIPANSKMNRFISFY